MNEAIALDRIRIVLVRTSHPGNIGAAARAMKTMGLSRLTLVQPHAFPDPVATARASGAEDVLAAAQRVDDLTTALKGTVLSAALTARRRDLAIPPLDSRAAVAEILSYAAQGEVALVFGNESSGLNNDELALCSLPVTIPSAPEFSSLNLGAAVQVMCYELRMGLLQGMAINWNQGQPASFEEIEGFHAHLQRAMRDSGFYDPANPKKLLPRLRRLFGRVRLEKEEVNILRGILSALEQKPD